MCYSPLHLAKSGSSYKGTFYPQGLNVPCGKCISCKKRRVNEWVHRLLQENKEAKTSLFVTLTYNEDHLPLVATKQDTKHYAAGELVPTLYPRDLQLFIKRLRKKHPNETIKFYACGEYGTKRKRPHYHLIIFNTEAETVITSWLGTDTGGTIEKRDRFTKEYDTFTVVRQGSIGTTPSIIGNVDISTVTGDSIAYTAKYIDKTCYIGHSNEDPRYPQFSRQSKGIGRNYVEKNRKWHLEGNTETTNDRHLVYVEGLYKTILPRYYRNHIFKAVISLKDDLKKRIVKNCYNKSQTRTEKFINHIKQKKEDDYERRLQKHRQAYHRERGKWQNIETRDYQKQRLERSRIEGKTRNDL